MVGNQLAEPALWSTLVHPQDLPRVHEMARKALAGQPDRGEMRYRARDGSEKVAYAIYQPSVQDGAVTGVTTLMVDVTRERQLERHLCDRVARPGAGGRRGDGAFGRSVPFAAALGEEIFERRRGGDTRGREVEHVVAAAPAEPRHAVAREDAEAH